MKRQRSPYRGPVLIALAQQAIITILLSLILANPPDVIPKIWGIALAAFWAEFILIRTRRRQSPTTADLMFIRWSTAPLLIVSMVLSSWIWSSLGKIE